jgi:hypothetical protein
MLPCLSFRPFAPALDQPFARLAAWLASRRSTLVAAFVAQGASIIPISNIR